MFAHHSGLSAAIRRVVDELDRGDAAPAGECVPPLDLYELDDAILAVIDLPGVPADAVQALVKEGVLVVAGEKPAPICAAAKDAARFHLAERGFGRFARAVRLTVPIDATRADATLDAGVLRVRLPRLDDRRGAPVRIPVVAK
jgi:HSP20 family protein